MHRTPIEALKALLDIASGFSEHQPALILPYLPTRARLGLEGGDS